MRRRPASSWKALAHLSFDIIVAGGAKSGMPGTEAVILLDRADATSLRRA